MVLVELAASTNTMVQWIQSRRGVPIRALNTEEEEPTMRKVRVMGAVAIIAASGLVLHVAKAQSQQKPAGINRIDLQRHDLSVPGREVVQTIVEIAPGVTSSRHTHPGEEIVYVLEGAPLEYALEGKPPVTLKPGDVLFIPAGTIHSAKNVGNRKGAELATYIVEKGKPLLTEVTK
jgi:quercetin dioxygenase-like cupin family protein